MCPRSLPQCIKIAISLSILLTYALQFYVPIAIMWPGIVQQFGPFKWPVLAEIVFRSFMCLVTCKYLLIQENCLSHAHLKVLRKIQRHISPLLIEIEKFLNFSSHSQPRKTKTTKSVRLVNANFPFSRSLLLSILRETCRCDS